MDPFDLWEGATFKLKVRKVDGQTSYDKSEFSEPSPLSDDDDKLEEIWKSQYKLSEFTDPTKFESYDVLKKRLARALGVAEDKPVTAEQMANKDATSKTVSEQSAGNSVSEQSAGNTVDDSDDDSDDDTMAFFENLANDE